MPSPDRPTSVPPVTAHQLFHVEIKNGARVIHKFEAMGPDRVAVQKQHEGMCAAGEQVIVSTPKEWDRRQPHPYSAEVLYNGSPESEARLKEINRGMDAWKDRP